MILPPPISAKPLGWVMETLTAADNYFADFIAGPGVWIVIFFSFAILPPMARTFSSSGRSSSGVLSSGESAGWTQLAEVSCWPVLGSPCSTKVAGTEAHHQESQVFWT